MLNSTINKEELKVKCRTKVQSLLNLDFLIIGSNGIQADNANRIATALEADDTYTLTIPKGECICIKVSDMVLHLLKPYLKDMFHIGQKASKSNYILFRYNSEFIERLEPLIRHNDQIQLVDSFEMTIKKTTLPTFTNRAKLYKVTKAPILKDKELSKILQLHQTIIENENSYFLLSANVSHRYNMPQNILRILGYNVLSLKALNLLELLLIFATNSTAIYRHASDDKPFAIPYNFIFHEDFSLKQSDEEVIKSFEELRSKGLIDEFELIKDKFIIESDIIAKSIKQYSYKQNLNHYKSLELHQQSYIYTFLNCLRYVKNIPVKTVTKDLIGDIAETDSKADKFTYSLESIIYSLELEEYIHDLAYLAKVLDNLQTIGIRQGLLIMPTNPQPITKEVVKYLFKYRDKLHEFFVINPNEPISDTQNFCSTFYNPIETATHYANGRKKINR